MSGGGVKCWGDNGAGELGDGTTTDRYTPVDVSGLGGGVAAISAGGSHSCALTSAGRVVCWGFNGYGQLGDGTMEKRTTPVAVSGLASDVAALASGGLHTCALTRIGAAECWGYNGSGQLGDGTMTDRHTPVTVAGLASGVAAIAPGGAHTCALTPVGGVVCWGGNWRGQLGDGTTTRRRTPVAVSGLASGVKALAAGNEHTCAVMAPGGVDCWGYNGSGQLGDRTTVNSVEPVGVIGFGGSLRCAVPYARKSLLPKARSLIAHAHCRVGTVKRVASRHLKNWVLAQSPRPYARLKQGAKVNLTVSR
jgi:alpha-tubulin suppressor-like RCC1 family protein